VDASQIASESTVPPALSVVVLNYNYGHYVAGCIESILSQSFRDFELIVIDDVSEDDSKAIIRPFAEADPRVRFVPHTINAGFAKSLIEGTEELSRGEFLMVISADDLVMHPDAFATQIEQLRRFPWTSFCFSAVNLVSNAGNVVDASYPSDIALDSATALRALFDQIARPAHSGTMLRKQHYLRSGGYRRDVKMALDLAMWVSLALQGGFAYSSLPLYGYRLHEGQMSAALPGIRRNAHEVRMILSEAWREGNRRGYDLGGGEREVFVRHFEACAIHEAFNRSRRLAAYRLLATALEAPLAAAVSRKLWIAAGRATLGRRGFSALKGALAQGRSLLGRA
jgi:glycosyltransferase involved in cell wall biosynthesis